jgi:hypothetical protein
MKISQRLYESTDANNLFLRQKEVQSHKNKLTLIKKRTSEYHFDDNKHVFHNMSGSPKKKFFFDDCIFILITDLRLFTCHGER